MLRRTSSACQLFSRGAPAWSHATSDAADIVSVVTNMWLWRVSSMPLSLGGRVFDHTSWKNRCGPRPVPTSLDCDVGVELRAGRCHGCRAAAGRSGWSRHQPSTCGGVKGQRSGHGTAPSNCTRSAGAASLLRIVQGGVGEVGDSKPGSQIISVLRFVSKTLFPYPCSRRGMNSSLGEEGWSTLV